MMAGRQAASGQVPVNSAFTWSLLLYMGYQFCFSMCAYLNNTLSMPWIWSALQFFYVFFLGLHFKLNQLSSNNSRHVSCIHKGLHTGKWLDLVTSKQDSASTLGSHWTDYTDAITQWCPSGNPVLMCIIGTHWKTTGATSTLGYHWNHTGWC